MFFDLKTTMSPLLQLLVAVMMTVEQVLKHFYQAQQSQLFKQFVSNLLSLVEQKGAVRQGQGCECFVDPFYHPMVSLISQSDEPPTQPQNHSNLTLLLLARLNNTYTKSSQACQGAHKQDFCASKIVSLAFHRIDYVHGLEIRLGLLPSSLPTVAQKSWDPPQLWVRASHLCRVEQMTDVAICQIYFPHQCSSDGCLYLSHYCYLSQSYRTCSQVWTFHCYIECHLRYHYRQLLHLCHQDCLYFISYNSWIWSFSWRFKLQLAVAPNTQKTMMAIIVLCQTNLATLYQHQQLLAQCFVAHMADFPTSSDLYCLEVFLQNLSQKPLSYHQIGWTRVRLGRKSLSTKHCSQHIVHSADCQFSPDLQVYRIHQN